MIEQVNGWYWPSVDTEARRLVPQEADRDIPRLMRHVNQRRLLVQAGGNTGWWARRCAKDFARVISIEADPINYACMCANGLPGNVATIHAALSNQPGWCRSCEYPGEPTNTGAIQAISNREGNVRTLRIDQLALDVCDAIWLDIEGGELPALWGARHTIKEHRPVLVIEQKGLGETFGWTGADLAEFMRSIEYRPVENVARDVVYLPCERPS